MNSTITDTVLEAKDIHVSYSQFLALRDVNLKIKRNMVTALIGPSGCGKSSLLRCFNRMNDLILTAKIDGQILFNNDNIYSNNVDPTEIRSRIGMVFQKPNPFPTSIFENVAYGPRNHGVETDKLDELVENCLKDAALWEEVHDRLDDSAMSLSGGQQQRLCIARALSVEPEIILMDEPTSALDPIATTKIEQLISELKSKYTVIIVTHNMQQAARISDYTGFMYIGELVEFGETAQIFEKPNEELTENYLTGRFG